MSEHTYAITLPSADCCYMYSRRIDDAYGFPPFRYFAPALVVDGMGYEELRAEERKILASALSGVRARRLATPDFSWADRISALARDQALLDIRRSSAFFGESRRVLDHLPQSAAADHFSAPSFG
jgi:hypothetical protein